MTQASRYIYAVSFALAAVGFLMQLWPISVVGVLLAAFSGRWLFAVIAALLIDLAWGTPTGIWQVLYFPLTAIALLGALLRIFGEKYLLHRDLPDRL